MKYIFRGKRIDNGEWVEGWYHECTKGEWLDPVQNGAFIQTFKQLDNGEIILTVIFEVDPATVGIGIKYNGKKYFAGDVLFCEGRWKQQIEFDCGCLLVRDLDRIRRTNLCVDTPLYDFVKEGSLEYWNVIGNIYDNPELLQAE